MGVPSWIRVDNGGSVLMIWVAAGASRSEIVGVHGDALKVRVAAPAEGGRANRALIGLLSERLGVEVELISGHASRRKQVRVPSSAPEAVVSRLLPRSPR